VELTQNQQKRSPKNGKNFKKWQEMAMGIIKKVSIRK
jgi:hypothetical protein